MFEPKETIAEMKYAPEEIRKKSGAVYDAILCKSPNIREANFDRTSSIDLELLFEQYNALFFEGGLRAMLDEAAATIQFRLSRRMSRAAGHTKRANARIRTGAAKEQFEIAISADMLFQTFNEDHRTITVNGLVCTDRLQALQRVFEHELLHLIELLTWGASSCKGHRFHTLAHKIFGHTATTHQLITHAEQAHTKYGLRAGDRVAFQYEGMRYTCLLNRITKRATILIESGTGNFYSDGKRYEKFYVPVHILERVK